MQELQHNPSKSELLKWINETLQIKITKIEQLGNGAIVCQLLDYLYPSTINLNKVNWKANQEVEFIKNFKLFAHALSKVHESKNIDVYSYQYYKLLLIASLSKCKKTHLLDLGQYLKQTYDQLHFKRFDYDPQKARKNEEIYLLGSKVIQSKINKENSNPMGCKKVKIEKCIRYEQIQEIMGLKDFNDDDKVQKIKSLFL